MSALLDPILAQELAKAVARHPNAVGASAMMEVLQKVAPTLGARTTDLTAMAKNPSFLARIGAAINVIRGVTPLTWFGPGQPIAPMAPKPEQGAVGRRFDYGVSHNIQFLPKTEIGAGVPFWMLRNLRDNYDLLSLVVETRKDQASGYEWAIVPKEKGKQKDDFADQVKRCSEFFERPGGSDLDWMDWLRQVVDDALVCDGIALYPRASRGGKLHSLVPVDVAGIKLLLDESGMSPEPPSPAYQQVLKGVPAVDYKRINGDGPAFDGNELIYWKRNGRTNRVYGYSPVEQVIATVNIAMRRQQYQLEYYTESNIPDSLIGVPDTWTPEQIEEFQQQFDSMLNTTAERRKARFVPDVKAILTLKDAQIALTDQADEWFARIICFAFSVTPSALLKMVNRASGEQIQETAKEEGNLPFLIWLAGKLTWVINEVLGCPDVKFAFKFSVEVDPQIKAQIRQNDVKVGIRTVDEVRAEEGLQPFGGNADEPLVYTATGPVPLEESVDRARENAENPPEPPAPFGAAGVPGKPKVGPDGKPVPPAPAAKKPAPAVLKKDEGGEDDGRQIHVHVGSPIVEVHTPPVRVGGVTVTQDLRPIRASSEGGLAKNDGPGKLRRARGRRDHATGDLLAEFEYDDIGVKTTTIERGK